MNDQRFNNKEDSDTEIGARAEFGRMNFDRKENNNRHEGVALTYEIGKIDRKATIRLTFLLPHDTEKTKFEVQEVTGASEEEYLKAIRELSNIVKNNDLLPENFPKGGKTKTRASALLQPRLTKPVPIDPMNDSADEVIEKRRLMVEYKKYKTREKANRIEVFRSYDKILGVQAYKDIFLDSLNEALDTYDTNNQGVADPPEFYTQDELDKHLKKVAKTVLPRDALRKQSRYLFRVNKPKALTAKIWIRRIQEINNFLPFFPDNNTSGTNAKFDALVINNHVILENIPDDWRFEFHKTVEYREMVNKDLAGQPSLEEIIDALENIESNEQNNKRRIPGTRNHGTRNPKNRYKNMCRKPEHNHEWKDCPDNKFNRNKTHREGMYCEQAPEETETEEREIFIGEEY